MASNEQNRPGYVRLNFDRGDLSFALKKYSPVKYLNGRGKSPESVKNQVMTSPKLRLLMEKARNGALFWAHDRILCTKKVLERVAFKVTCAGNRIRVSVLCNSDRC